MFDNRQAQCEHFKSFASSQWYLVGGREGERERERENVHQGTFFLAGGVTKHTLYSQEMPSCAQSRLVCLYWIHCVSTVFARDQEKHDTGDRIWRFGVVPSGVCLQSNYYLTSGFCWAENYQNNQHTTTQIKLAKFHFKAKYLLILSTSK